MKTLSRILLLSLLLCGSLSVPCAAAEPAAPSDDQVAATIDLLEDPQARARLVEQLRLLQQAQAGETPTALESAATSLLTDLSARIRSLSERLLAATGRLQDLPQIYDWLHTQATTPARQTLWQSVIGNLLLTLGSGYVAWLSVQFLMRRPLRALGATGGRGWLLRSLTLLPVLLLELLPVAAFAGVAYVALGLVAPREETRLVVLAWVYAFLIVHTLRALVRTAVAPDVPGLRLPPLSDETAHYLEIWTGRLAATAAYGFFLLEAALLLGLGPNLHALLLRVLGLVVAVLVAIFILQNREPVAAFIRGPRTEAPASAVVRSVRGGLARIWHLAALFYTAVLYLIWALEITGGFLFLLRGTLVTVAALLIGRLATVGAGVLLARRFGISDTLKQRFPGLERRANRYLPLLHTVLRAAIAVLVTLVILQAWGLGALDWLLTGPGQSLGALLARVAGIVAVALVVWESGGGLIERNLADTDVNGQARIRSARTRTLLSVARNALLVVVTVISLLMVLSEFGVNIAPLLAGAGVVGLAVGFGAQKLVQDVITGVFILFQDLMSVGDVVKLGDHAGVVEALSIRSVRLRDVTGTVHTIPFSAIDTVSNLTRDFSFYVFEVGVAYREDVDQVMDLIRAIGAELREDESVGSFVLEPIEVFGVDAFADSAVIIKGRIKTLPLKQWGVGRAFNRLLKIRFDEAGIEIPFPHVTLYFGADRNGEAPPAFVELAQAAATPARAP